MSREPIDVLRESYRRAAAITLAEAEVRFSEHAALCESPIERIMFAAMAFEESVGVGLNERPAEPLFWSPDDLTGATAGPPGAYIAPQVQIGNFRVDFVVHLTSEAGTSVKVVVECDGHDFHDRTPEQAARDKSRDREIAIVGYQVLRFTGREIVRSPHDCANQVWAFLRNRIDEIEGRE